MKNIFKRLFQHRCDFYKPIVSQYSSFNCRNIIYQCKCGKRKKYKICKEFSSPFDIQTTAFITNQEMDKILNNDLELHKSS